MCKKTHVIACEMYVLGRFLCESHVKTMESHKMGLHVQHETQKSSKTQFFFAHVKVWCVFCKSLSFVSILENFHNQIK